MILGLYGCFKTLDTKGMAKADLFLLSYLGGEGRVHPSPQPAGQRGEEEDPFGAGERGAEGATAGPGGGQTGPATGDRQGRITVPLNRLHRGRA